MKNNSFTSLTPPGTLTQLPTTTQTTSQQSQNRIRLPPLTAKPYHASATRNTINILPQPASQELTPTTNNIQMKSSISQLVITTAQPSTPHTTASDGPRHPKLQPINRPTRYSTNTQLPDPATHSIHYTTGKHPPTFQHNIPSLDAITHPTLISHPTDCQLPPATATSPFPQCEHTSLLKDHPNPILALKEVAFSINETLDRLFTIIAQLPTSSVCHYMTKTSSNTIDSNMRATQYSTYPKHDTIPTRNQPDLYKLMSALLPTIYNPFSHLHELKNTPLTVLLFSKPKNSQQTTNSSAHSGNLSAKNSHHHTGTLDTLGLGLLQQYLPQPPQHSKDLWKPP